MSEQTETPEVDVCPEVTGNGCFDHACDTTCKVLGMMPPHAQRDGKCQRDGDDWPCTAFLVMLGARAEGDR